MTSRRMFLGSLGAVASAGWLRTLRAGAELGPLPRRVLGRTGVEVSLIGLGSAPVGHAKLGADIGPAIYEAALEAGVNYVDTARNYDDAESYLAGLLPKWRDRVFLATKARPKGRTPGELTAAMRVQFEGSLRTLRVENVDLLHIHSAADFEPELLLAAGGPMDFLREMKQQGKTRFIGVTAHNRPARLVPLIETGDIDVIMVALNFVDTHQYGFESLVLPEARRHRCGILAMKVYGGRRGGFPNYRTPGPCQMEPGDLEQAQRYALSIEGVSAAVLGVYGAKEMAESLEWARRWKPLTEEEREALLKQGAERVAAWGPRLGPVG